jgi:hypothetical protein
LFIEHQNLLLGIKLKVNCLKTRYLEHSDTNAAFKIALCLGSNLGKNDMEKPKAFPEVIKTEDLALREGNSKGSIETLEPQYL